MTRTLCVARIGEVVIRQMGFYLFPQLLAILQQRTWRRDARFRRRVARKEPCAPASCVKWNHSAAHEDADNSDRWDFRTHLQVWLLCVTGIKVRQKITERRRRGRKVRVSLASCLGARCNSPLSARNRIRLMNAIRIRGTRVKIVTKSRVTCAQTES